MSLLRLALAAMIVGATLVPALAQTAPHTFNVILEMTGPGAFAGQAEAQSLKALERYVNEHGGIRGQPIRFEVYDNQTSPQVSLQLATEIVAKRAPIIFGSAIVSTCSSVGALVAQTGPVQYCFSPGYLPAKDSYAFAAGPLVDDALLVLVRYFRERGWKRLAAIASTDGSGQSYTSSLQHALAAPENKDVQLVALERMNPGDISVAGQLARIKAANPQALFTLATGTPWGTMMRGASDAGIDVPIAGGHGNAVYGQLAQYKSFLPASVYFPGVLSLAEGSVGKGPIKDAQAIYFNAFKQLGIVPDAAHNSPWDAAMIVIDALRRLGPNATASQLHDYILNLHGWVGINGVYDFRDGTQRGITARALAVYRYDNAKGLFIAASGSGGTLK